MPLKRTLTSETSVITLDAIQQLIANGIATALEAQAATMASASNPNRNTGPTGTPVSKTGNYKEFSIRRRFVAKNFNDLQTKDCGIKGNNYHINNNNYQKYGCNNNNRNNDYHQQQNRRQENLQDLCCHQWVYWESSLM
ncbi:hypothetical protein Tco_0685984 [Tanacetum coccineum]